MNSAFLATIMSLLCIGHLSIIGDEEAVEHGSPQAEYAVVPTTRLSLRVPSGFQQNQGDPGFFHSKTRSSIIVHTISGPFQRVLASLTDPELLERKGLKITSREARAMGELQGEWLEAQRSSQGQEIRQWYWIFGDDHESFMIVGSFLTKIAAEDQAMIREAILSAAWTEDLLGPPLEELPFQLTDTADLQFARTNLQQVVYASEGGPESPQRHFRCGPMPVLCLGDREAFARDQMGRLTGHGPVSLGTLRPIEIDGLSGFECKVEATHTRSRQVQFVYRVILFEGSQPWSLTGQGPNEWRGTLLSEFKTVSQSLERRFDVLTSEASGVRISAPSTWTTRDGLIEDAAIQVAHPTGGSSLIVLSDLKSGLEAGSDLESYSIAARQFLEEDGTRVSEPQPVECGSHPAIRCDYTIEEEGFSERWVHVSLEGKGAMFQLVFWTDAELFETQEADLTRILGSIELFSH